MKTSLVRILCLVLALMLSVSLFVGCSGDDDVTETDVPSEVTSVPEDVVVEVTEDDPYAIAKDEDGKDLVILTPNEDGSITMNVAADTTVETFLSLVTAKEGHTIKLTDKDGKEVTDKKAVIADGMKFEIYKDGEETALENYTYTIKVVSEEEIASTVQQQVLIESQQNEASKVSSKDDESKVEQPGNEGGSTTTAETVVFSSIFAGSYQGSDATGQAWQSALNVNKSAGINTTIANLDANTGVELIANQVRAGKSDADVYDISLGMTRALARQGMLCNMYDSKTLNKSLFNTAATEAVTFSGKAYGVAFAAKSTTAMGVIYNKGIVGQYAKDYDINKLYNDKKWNFDNFRAIAKACTQDTNGDKKTDIYGFTSNTNVIGMALTANAGGTALMVNGRVEATMCNDKGIAALEWCKEMREKDKSWSYKADINTCADDFAAGKAAMFVSYLHFNKTIVSKADFKVGFVLMPMGPGQTEYKNGTYDASMYVVTTPKKGRLDVVGTWLNNMATANNKLINVNVRELQNNGFDSTSTNIYKWLVNNMTAEYSTGPFSSEVSQKVDGSVTSKSSTPAKVMKAIQSQAQKECDDYYAPLY